MNAKKRKKISSSTYKKRSYRQAIVVPAGLISNFVTVQETDLHIMAPGNIEEDGHHFVHRYRNQRENYIGFHPDFLTALILLKPDALAPPIIKDMQQAAATANVGPMASIAGAIAEYVGRDFLDAGLEEVMVENGGDIFLIGLD
jgi:ApbE superfamily uncharacterized protein (UPF0280 family)